MPVERGLKGGRANTCVGFGACCFIAEPAAVFDILASGKEAPIAPSARGLGSCGDSEVQWQRKRHRKRKRHRALTSCLAWFAIARQRAKSLSDRSNGPSANPGRAGAFRRSVTDKRSRVVAPGRSGSRKRGDFTRLSLVRALLGKAVGDVVKVGAVRPTVEGLFPDGNWTVLPTPINDSGAIPFFEMQFGVFSDPYGARR